MFRELQELVTDMGLSPGQLLIIAREVSGNGNLRTTDLLTVEQRKALIAELQQLRNCLEVAYS